MLFRRIRKILGWSVLVIIVLLLTTAFLLTRSSVQTKLAKEAAGYFSNKLNTKVSIDKVRVDFFKYVHFEGLYVEDQQQDTLAYLRDFRLKTSSIIADIWKDKTSIIKDVKLAGGIVNLNRSSDGGNWNYAFIEDAFSNDEKDSSTSSPINLDLKNIIVQDVRFAMLDAWGGQDIKADLGSMTVKVNGVDIPNLVFNVKSVDIENTNFAFEDYKGGKTSKKDKRRDKNTWGSPFNPAGLVLNLKDLSLKDVNFEYRKNKHVSKAGRFDERHIVAKDIQLKLEELGVTGDTVTADILSLTTQERSGLAIKQLRAKVTLNQQLAELSDLYLETNHSIVKDYYSMNYTNFHDFNQYIDNVSMYARFKNSVIDKRDIAFFSGDVREIPTRTKLNGIGEGTVANLHIPKIQLQAPDLSYQGSANIKGLPDINNTLFELNADKLTTTGKEVVRIAPQANTDAINWNGLNEIGFTGKFTGGIREFKAEGFLTSNQGNVDLDMFMNLTGSVPEYNGYVKTYDLQLGKILDKKNFGSVSMTGNIEGKGFDFNNLNTKVDAMASQITFDGISYQNVSLDGFVRDKQFSGSAKSRDAKLGFDFNGNVNLSGDNPSYDFKSDILKVNLKTLGITPQDVFLQAKVNLDFKGKTIDEFVGKVIMQDVVLNYGKEELKIPQLRLNSYFTDSLGKVLDLKSTVADARVDGQYSFAGIDKSIRSFLHYYIPTYIAEEFLPENEIFEFNLLVKDANKLIKIFEPNLLVDSGAVFQGDINTQNQSLNLVGLLPSLSYQGVTLNQIGLKSNGNRNVFKSEIIGGKFKVGTSEIAKDVKLEVAMSSDTASFNLKTSPVDDFLGQAELVGRATAFTDRVELEIKPSSFIIKDDKYRLFSFHPIQFTNNGVFLAKDVLIKNGNQQFVFNSNFDGVKNNASVELENIDLEKISSYLNSENLVLKGRVNSKVKIADLWGKTAINGTLKSVDELRLKNDTLGIADLGFSYNKDINKLVFSKNSKLENGRTYLYPSGSIDFDKNTLDIKVDMQQIPISFANQYIDDLVDSLQGKASGKLSISGPMNNPVIVGNMNIKEASGKLIYTACSYKLDDFNVRLNENAISFDPIKIYDQREQPGTAILSGTVKHSNYDTYKLNLNISSEDFLGLNTNEINGELFYGRIASKFNMDIKGAIDNIVMDIKAKPLKGAEFYLPLKSSGDASSYDFITFRTLGKYQSDKKKKKKSASYFKVNMDIEATPDVLATIILDPNTQEKIEARGYGNISLVVDLGNDINMYNSFTVQEGIYKFNFRGLLPRDFELEKGGTITWNGDAYDAELDMKAIYKTKIPLYPLISTEHDLDNSQLTAEDVAIAQREEETHVIVDLTESLSKPIINFDIQQPYNNAIGSPGMNKLDAIRKNGSEKEIQKELVYQAGMILLINSFRPPGGAIDAGAVAQNTYESTVSDIIGSALSPVLNNFIDKLGLKGLSINLGYKNYTTAVTSGNALAERKQVNFDLNYKFNSRFLISFGNSLDFANANAQAVGANSLTYGGDFRGQYLLTKDGRYRLNAFTVTNYDYVDNRPETRGGIGLSYKKSFNNWSGLFKRAKRTNVVDEVIKRTPAQTGKMKKEEEPSVTMALDILSKISF